MKILYIECNMGVAGDMLMGALLELLPDKGIFLDKVNSIGIPGVEFSAHKSLKCGITGTHMRVLVNGKEEGHCGAHEHHHNSLKDIKEIINSLNVSDTVKNNASSIYNIIADAESKVHDVHVDNIHFHEVGTLDAIADIVGCCMLFEEIGADCIVASPIRIGSGHVHCAHGVLPVPAPATAIILQGIPIYSGNIQGELCTPTGAALVKYFASDFAPMPEMTIQKIGYGMGTKDFSQVSCVRAMLGETFSLDESDEITELSCNIDDMTGEEIGFATEVLLKAGAKDVFTEAITMKKSRPAIKLTVIAGIADVERIVSLIFKHTSTLGIRQYKCGRYVLSRHIEKRETPYGQIDFKVCEGYGVKREKAEFDQLRKIAVENDLSIQQIKSTIE